MVGVRMQEGPCTRRFSPKGKEPRVDSAVLTVNSFGPPFLCCEGEQTWGPSKVEPFKGKKCHFTACVSSIVA